MSKNRYSIERKERRRSSLRLIYLLSRRKSLQTTTMAIRRQSLWMNLSMNHQSFHHFQSTIPIKNQSLSSSSSSLSSINLLRKKIFRLFLVFSYLISISLLAIGLATFYGLFWSGYTQTSLSITNSSFIYLS